MRVINPINHEQKTYADHNVINNIDSTGMRAAGAQHSSYAE